MKISDSVQDRATLSGVTTLGEFRIRNSSKAFSILSSGLYANKIRAIIRELSTNAIDSHVASGRADTPFDVHLPTALEPWFSIRDYGLGLSHDDVINVYTTYFESTKTDSNDFVGALGLGSKSPFSYTDTFTVVAIKSGIRGIYTAFINDQGVPSIALMGSAESSDPSGVEVRFNVSNSQDHRKFREEAQIVYEHFSRKPVVNLSDFTHITTEYKTRDIIPGVHELKAARGNARAIMGNICYPLDVPMANQSLGDLARYLNLPLELHFDIGELDIQASREGLSYIPSTVEAIRNKLQALCDACELEIRSQADALENDWHKMFYLWERYHRDVWWASVKKYLRHTPFVFADDQANLSMMITLNLPDIEKNYNISLRNFCQNNSGRRGGQLREVTQRSSIHHMPVHRNVRIVDATGAKSGLLRRVREHFASEADVQVFMLTPCDKTQPMNVQGFLKSLNNPPTELLFTESAIPKIARGKSPGRSARSKDKTLLKLTAITNRRNHYTDARWSRCDSDVVTVNKNTKKYYVLMKQFEVLNWPYSTDIKALYERIWESGFIQSNQIYGISEGWLPEVQADPNWAELGQALREQVSALDTDTLYALWGIGGIDRGMFSQYNDVAVMVNRKDSEFFLGLTAPKTAPTITWRAYQSHSVKHIVRIVAPEVHDRMNTEHQGFEKRVVQFYQKYPLLKNINYSTKTEDIAQYVNALDQIS